MGSSNANRVTQHRNQRETEAKEKAQLKRENKALRKQLTRMRRQLQKMMETYAGASEAAQEVAAEAVVPAKAAVGSGCEKCGSMSVKRLSIPSGILVVCTDCLHRKKVTK